MAETVGLAVVALVLGGMFLALLGLVAWLLRGNGEGGGES